MKPSVFTVLAILLLVPAVACQNNGISKSFVEVSTENPYYFQLSDGDTYIPIGCNIAAIDSRESMEKYMKKLHENGGNYARIWLNSDLFEIEKEYGKIDSASVGNIDRIIELADMYGIKLKMCVESFRHIREGENQWDTKASYHVSNGGPFHDMTEYLDSPQGKKEFINRLMFFKNRYGDNPAIFGWELWNEMNAVEFRDIPQILAWTEEMLDETKKIFPKNLVMQSLGSYDSDWCTEAYDYVNALPGDEVSQIHRYIDEGAPYSICSSPVDIMSSDAVGILRNMNLKKPMLLAETGAVKPRHSGPHGMYDKDTAGVVLHDALFAPFFSGAAGPGHIWHWDYYVDKNDVWYQMKRFANAVSGFDPVKEKPVPVKVFDEHIRSYALIGNRTALIWCRDAMNDWKSEFEENIPPAVKKGIIITLDDFFDCEKIKSIQVYDPWKDSWQKLHPGTVIELPDFRRSLVLEIKYI